MTVSAQTLAFEYAANGVTTTFPYGFRVLYADQVKVYVNGTLQVGGYTLTGVGDAGGGNVVFTVAPVNGSTVLVRRISDRVRTTDFQQAPYFTQEELLDQDQDYQTMLLQEASADAVNAIRIPAVETNVVELPDAATRANKFLQFTGTGDVALSDGTGDNATTYYAATKSAGDTLAASLADGATVITDEDEAATPAGVQTRRTVSGGVLSAIASFLKTSMIAWKHGGTGAVWRTLYARLMDLPISVKDFGAVGDGTTDNYAAIMAAIDSYTGSESGFYVTGPTVMFPAGDYYCSQAINIKKTLRLIGETGGHQSTQATTITFPAGSDGIIVNRYNTNGPTGTTTSGKGGDGSLIEGIAVRQKDYVWSAAPVLDYNAANSQFISNIQGAVFADGSVVYVPSEQLASLGGGTVVSSDTTSRVLDIAGSPQGFVLGETVTGGTSGATGIVVYVGAQTKALCLKTVSGTFVAVETVTGGTSAKSAKVAAVYSRTLTVYTLSGITGTFALGKVAIRTADYGTGFRLRGRATIRKCQAQAWPNYGVAVIAGEVGGTNANLSVLEDISALGIGLHGFVTNSGDANAGKFSGLNAVSCGGYGIYDASFLGNHYYSCHASVCGAGAYYSAFQNNFSVFLGCYSEGLEQTQPFRVPRSTFGKETTIIGGDHGAGIDPTDTGYTSHNAGYAYLNGRSFRIGNGIVMDGGLDAAGKLAKTLRLNAIGGLPVPLTLSMGGNSNNGSGPAMAYNLPLSNAVAPIREDGSDTIRGGTTGVYRGAYHGSTFGIDLIPQGSLGVGSNIVVTGGSPTSAAIFYPIVVGGVITSLQMTFSGAGYTSAPALTGTGEWAGFTATTEVFNGQVVAYTITNGLTGRISTTPVRAFEGNSYWWVAGADNATTLGTAAKRWSTVYAGTGTINTSDDREKTYLDISDAETACAIELKGLMRKFKFNDAIEKKGSAARIHFGTSAQAVIATFEKHGLVAESYAIVCYDKWDEETNDDGDVLRESGDRYGIRYDELLCFIVSAM